MKLLGLVFTILLLTHQVHAEEVLRIEIGKDYNKYSDSDLRKRVWELERAVWQLQQKVFQLESDKGSSKVDTWVCTIKAMGDTFDGTGPSKAIATVKATKACKDAHNGDGFFCKDPKCEE